MPQHKKILISIDDSLLQEVDNIAAGSNVSRSAIIDEAICGYIKEYKKSQMEESMKKGYQEMGEINLSLAEMCFEADRQQLARYEEKLAECE